MGSRIAVTIVLFATALVPACGGGKPAPDAKAVDSGPTVDSNSACGGTLAPLATCTTDNMCISCTCRSFGHTSACTKTCTVAGDCPAPFSGCTNGVCQP